MVPGRIPGLGWARGTLFECPAGAAADDQTILLAAQGWGLRPSAPLSGGRCHGDTQGILGTLPFWRGDWAPTAPPAGRRSQESPEAGRSAAHPVHISQALGGLEFKLCPPNRFFLMATSHLTCGTRDLCWGMWPLVEARGLFVVVRSLLSSCGLWVFSSLVVARWLQGVWAL